jgi:hypothetical protein
MQLHSVFKTVAVTDNSKDTRSLHNMSISVHYNTLLFYKSGPCTILFKPVKVTYNYNDTSLQSMLSIFCILHILNVL